jgi:putative transposase
VLWHSNYHIVWTPKYRYRILEGKVKEAIDRAIRVFSERLKCEIIELNVQIDHVHLLVMIPPKISISTYMGIIKGKSAITIFKGFPQLKQRPYWGNHFWAQGYCVDTVGLNLEMIRKYVKYQEKQEKFVKINY